jgi:hypothetical protein
MANEIHNYPISTALIGDLDYYDTDRWNGLAYESAKIQGVDLKNELKTFLAKDKGSLFDLTTQIAPAINTPTAMQLNSYDSFSTGVTVVNDSLGNPTEITVAKTGVYDLQFSAQIERGSGGSAKQISIWLRKMGVDIANSNTHLTVVANSGRLVAAWNFLVDLTAGQNVQLMYSVADISIELKYQTNDLLVPHPATPSVIVTMTEI